MADRCREFRVGCYIFSLDRIPTHEERAAEELAYDLQNHIPISSGWAQGIDDWGIPFPTIMPDPYPPTLRPPIEPAQYIGMPTIAVKAGMPCFTRNPARILHQPLQPQILRSKSTQTLPHPHPAPFQLHPSIVQYVQPSIHAQNPILDITAPDNSEGTFNRGPLSSRCNSRQERYLERSPARWTGSGLEPPIKQLATLLA